MKKMILTLTVVVAMALLILIVNVIEKNDLQQQNQLYDTINKLLTATINNEKTQALSLAIALSNSRSIQDALLEDNKELGGTVLPNMILSFMKHLDKKVYAQVLTNDLFVFARSWESYFSHIPMQIDRPDLRELVRSKRPRTGIESGIPLGIKAAAPILFKEKTLGVFEITTPFDIIVSRLRESQIEIIPLIRADAVPEAYSRYKKFPVIGNAFVVVNTNVNRQLLKELASLDEEEYSMLLQNEFLSKSPWYFAAYPILDGRGEKLGFFIAIASKGEYKNFIDRQKSILKSIFEMGSTKEDIYDLTKQENENIFEEMDEEYILHANKLVEEKDRIHFEEAARRKLQHLSKEELVDLILEKYHTKAMRGEIR